MANVPEVLSRACEELLALLAKGIERSQSCDFDDPDFANKPASQPHGIGRELPTHVEQFVDALKPINFAWEELERRAFLVESYCYEEGGYDLARRAALASYRGRPRAISASRTALADLRMNQKLNPIYLGNIRQTRESIETILSEGVLGLSEKARQAFREWRDCCRVIEREANMLEVDGCRYLYHLHGAGEQQPGEGDGMVRAIATNGELGGTALTEMHKAAPAMLAWVAEHAMPSSSKPFTPAPASSPQEALTQLETVRDEVRQAAYYKANQAQLNYSNDTIQSVVKGIHWEHAREQLPLLSELPDKELQAVERVLKRELSPTTVEQIAELFTPVVSALRNAWEEYKAGGKPENVKSETINRRRLASDDTEPQQTSIELSNAQQGEATGKLLNLYTNGLAADRLGKAELVLSNSTLTAEVKLWELDSLMPIPASTSGQMLGNLLGVSKAAIQKTSWWKEKRAGQRDKQIERRHEQHLRRGQSYEANELRRDED